MKRLMTNVCLIKEFSFYMISFNLKAHNTLAIMWSWCFDEMIKRNFLQVVVLDFHTTGIYKMYSHQNIS